MFSSPLDLLTNSADEQILIRCLIRTPELTRSEIAYKTNLSLAELDSVLEKLLRNNKVIQHGQNGQATFSAKFAPVSRTPTPSLLDSLFA